MSAPYVLATPFPLTGNEIVDVTTNGYKWYFPAGVPRVLNWSVSSSLWTYPILQSTETQADFARAFGNIQEFINVQFNFLGYINGTTGLAGYENAYFTGSDLNITYAFNGTTSSGTTLSDGKFTTNSQTAFCYFPDLDYNSEYSGAAGDTFLNYNNSFLANATFENGTSSFALLLHEILHGLGLKHPHDSGGTGRPTYTQLGIKFADRQWISIMSYDRYENGGDGAYSGSQPIGPMLLDAIALQYLYGESAFNSGDTTYDLKQYLGDYYNCQWDASGTDLLDAGNLTYGVVVELDGGQLSNGLNLHRVGFITTALDYIALSLTNPSKWTWLWGEYENVNGSPYADIISGNDLANVINGGNGDDYLSGGSGDDRFDWDVSLRGGDDTFAGGPGNDIYVLDSIRDVVKEDSFEGVDTVFVGFNYSIANTAIENVKTFSNQTSAITFMGNSWTNVLEGGSGNDSLYGGGGSDTLKGGLGDDLIDGGLDTDYAVFSSAFSELSFKASGPDIIVTSKGEGTDTLRNIEFINVDGTVYNLSNILTSTLPTYKLTTVDSTVNEGTSASFTLTTTNVAANTSLNYTITGVSAADITGGSLSGATTVGANGQATISIPLAADQTTEGDETLTVTVQGQSASTTVKDTSLTPAPTYALAAGATSYNEGTSASFTLTTTNVAANTSLNYTITGVSAADITGGSLSGATTVGANGQATISIPLAADQTTEGDETLTVTVQGQSASTTVKDTSLTPAPTYALAAGATSYNEGTSASFTLTTTNVAANTSLNYTITGVSAADITGGSLSGATTVGANGQATISIPLAADQTTEGDETLTVTVQGQSASTTVKDTSLTPAPTYALAAGATSYNEGTSASFTLTTTNVAANTSLNYTITGVSAADITGGSLSGATTVGANGQATISIPLAADQTTEGDETLTVTVQGQSASTTVKDTSLTPAPTYALAAGATSYNEGTSASFTLTTTNVAANTSLNYTITGVSAADITGGSLSGATTVGANGQATISIPLAADQTTEGDETLTVTVQGQSASTTVKDTSLTPALTSTALFSWTKLIPAKAYQEQQSRITTTTDGSVYIVGSAHSGLDGEPSKGNLDAFLSKYTATGERAWTRIIGTGSDDAGYSVSASGDSVYVVGSTRGNLDGLVNTGEWWQSDAFVTSFSSSGDRRWTALLGTETNDTAYGIASSQDGSVFVVGQTSGNLGSQINNGSPDAFISKLSPEGLNQWTRLIGRGHPDRATAVAVGADGSVFVTGRTQGAYLDGQVENGAFLTRFSGNGESLWTKVFASPTGRMYEEAYGLTVAPDGSVYIVGSADFDRDTLLPSPSGDGGFVTKFSSSGVQIWSRFISSSGLDSATGVSVLNDGRICVVGHVGAAISELSFSGGNADAFIAVFTSDGVHDSTKVFGTNGDDKVTGISIDTSSNVYLTGSTTGNFAGEKNSGFSSGDLFVTSVNLIVDTIPPTITITSQKSALKAGETATVSFTLSEPSTDFGESDITVTGGSLSDFTGSELAYSATFTPIANSTTPGVISVASDKFSDAAGNFNKDGSDANNTVSMAVDTLIRTVQFATTSSSSIEGNNGSSVINAQATLSAASTQAVTLPITYSGIATLGTDYTNATTSITIPAGQTTGTATFSVIGDTTVEPDETVIITLGTPTNATLGTNVTFTHTITNDDTVDAPERTGRTKYFVTQNVGGNFTDFDLDHPGLTLQNELIEFIGSAGVDTAFVRPGVVLDFTFSGAGSDKVYLPGVFADYSTSLAGNTMTLQSGSGSTLEKVSVVAATSVEASDQLVFSDGVVNSHALYGHMLGQQAAPVPNSSETSNAPLPPAQPGSPLDATIKAFGLNPDGDTFATMKPGVALMAHGGIGVDKVYVADGSIVDAIFLGPSADEIYFRGAWAEYSKVVAGTSIVFTRTMGAATESVTVAASSGALDDVLIFANGSVSSLKAREALATNPSATLQSIVSYNANQVTPGVGPALKNQVLDNVSNLDPTSNLVLTFSEPVTAMAGKSIRIVDDGGDGPSGAGFRGESRFLSYTLPVDGSDVTVMGNKVTINPAVDLDLATKYHIEIDQGAFVGANGKLSDAFNGTVTLNFTTVTPGTDTVAQASQSRKFDATGALVESYRWLDIEGIGSPSGARTDLDLSQTSVALVFKDYATRAAGTPTGYDGVGPASFNVGANGFGVNDLIYIDSQTTVPNDLTKTSFFNNGTSPTRIYFPPDTDANPSSLGGYLDVTLIGSTQPFTSINDWMAKLPSTVPPMISG